jgi:hypothetical protein
MKIKIIILSVIGYFIYGCSAGHLQDSQDITTLKSLRFTDLGENEKLNKLEQEVLSEFLKGPVCKSLFSGTDPAVQSREEISSLAFSSIPVFTVKSEVKEALTVGDINIQDKLELSDNDMFFIGRLNGNIVTFIMAYKSPKQSWIFQVPTEKTNSMRWGQAYQGIVEKAEKGEVFMLRHGFNFLTGYFVEGKLHWKLSPLSANDFSESDLVKLMINERQQYNDYIHSKQGNAVNPKN